MNSIIDSIGARIRNRAILPPLWRPFTDLHRDHHQPPQREHVQEPRLPPAAPRYCDLVSQSTPVVTPVLHAVDPPRDPPRLTLRHERPGARQDAHASDALASRMHPRPSTPVTAGPGPGPPAQPNLARLQSRHLSQSRHCSGKRCSSHVRVRVQVCDWGAYGHGEGEEAHEGPADDHGCHHAPDGPPHPGVPLRPPLPCAPLALIPVKCGGQ
jgi:hypothetical protein